MKKNSKDFDIFQQIFSIKINDKIIEINLSSEEIEKFRKLYIHKIARIAQEIYQEYKDKLPNNLIETILYLSCSPFYYDLTKIVKNIMVKKVKDLNDKSK